MMEDSLLAVPAADLTGSVAELLVAYSNLIVASPPQFRYEIPVAEPGVPPFRMEMWTNRSTSYRKAVFGHRR